MKFPPLTASHSQFKTAFLAGWLSLACSVCRAGSNETGRVAVSFLEINPAVRLVGLGGDQPAAFGYLEAMYSNPASLTSLSAAEVWLAHNQSFLDTKYETLAIGFPFKKQALGFSARYIDEGRLERTGIDSSNDVILTGEDFRPYTGFLQASWAARPVNHVSLGLTGKAWKQKLDKTSSQGWAADAGLLFSFTSYLDAGLAYRNLGPSVDGYDLPRSLATGIGIHLPVPVLSKASIYSQLDFSSFRDTVWRSGVELGKGPVWLRVGRSDLNSSDSGEFNKFSFGGGVRIRGWRVDYAWNDKGELGSQHQFSVGIALGLTPEEKRAAAQQLDEAMDRRMKKRAEELVAAGDAAIKQERWEGAILEYSKAITWDPESETAHAKLTKARALKQEHDAEKLYSEGILFAEQRRWVDATLQLQEALKMNPRHAQAAELLRKTKSKVVALTEPDESKNAVQLAYNRGVLHYVNGRFDNALADWNYVLKESPNWPNIHEYAAKAKAKKLELELKNRPQDSMAMKIETLSQKAYTFYSLGSYDEAIAAWRKILALEPENKDAQWALEEALEKKKLLNGNAQSKPHSVVEVMNARALQAYSEGRLDSAIRIWRQALAADPHNVKIKNNLKRVESERILKGN